MNENEAIYACVHKYKENKHNNIARPDNSVCFYLDNDVYCIARRYTNIKECDKSSKNFNYRTCSYDILSLTNDGSERYTYRFRSYPEKVLMQFKIKKNVRLVMVLFLLTM